MTPLKWLVAATSLIAIASAEAAPVDINARIVRDDWGVPHIFAEREEDAIFAVGYAQAEDRLEQIFVKYKQTRGELAMLDPAIVSHNLGRDVDAAASDLWVRQGRYAEKAIAAWPKLSPQLRKDYIFFIAGVRKYIDEHPEKVPVWAPKLSPDLPMTTAFIQQYGDAIDMGLRDCERSGMDKAATASAQRPQSNTWVVGPSRTRDGNAILAFDPHAELGARPEYSLHVAGINAYVGTDIGNFYPLYGHNDALAWGATSGGPDVADCYLVQVDRKNPYRFQFDGVWKTMPTVKDRLPHRDGTSTPVTFAYTNHNGVASPVVGRRGDLAYVVSTPAIGAMADFSEANYRLFRTRSVAAFRANLMGLSPYEYAAADNAGNIYFVMNGRVPKRPEGFNWSYAVPGNTSATAWTGVRPVTDLPQLENPKAGYLQLNNTHSDFVTDGSTLNLDNYPRDLYYPEDPEKDHFYGPRSRRIIQLLEPLHNATFEDMEAISQDQLLPFVGRWQGALQRALKQHPKWLPSQSPDIQMLVASVLAYDGIDHHESVPAAHYYFWRMQMAKGTALGPYALVKLIGRVQFYSDQLSPTEEEVLLDGFVKARDEMVRRRGAIDRPLGDFFRIGRGSESFPIGGIPIRPVPVAPDMPWIEEQPIRLSFEPSKIEADGRGYVDGGPRSAFVVELGKTVRSVSAIPWGVSWDPASPHYDDQAKLVSERKFKENRFTIQEINLHTKSTKILEIKVDINTR